jgi:hypothetical protein
MTTKPDVTPKPVSPKPAAKKKAAGVSASAGKAKPGRPSAYTKALGDSICSQIADGKSLRAICAKTGMPSKSMVLRWLDAESAQQFRDQYARAREAQADLLAEEMLEIADDSSLDVLTDKDGNERPNTEFVTRSRLRVDTRKWLASKMAPKRYGDKIEHTGADGGAIQHSVKIEFI